MPARGARTAKHKVSDSGVASRQSSRRAKGRWTDGSARALRRARHGRIAEGMNTTPNVDSAGALAKWRTREDRFEIRSRASSL